LLIALVIEREGQNAEGREALFLSKEQANKGMHNFSTQPYLLVHMSIKQPKQACPISCALQV